MADIAEPSDWLFDGTDPERDLRTEEAEQVRAQSVIFGEPICTPLPESAVDAVRELFRGFYSHTPYRRLSAFEQPDDETIVVSGEKRSHVDDPDGWEPHIHTRDIEAMQAELTSFFGPLWRIKRKQAEDDRSQTVPGTLVIRRVIGRQFHYRDQEGEDR